MKFRELDPEIALKAIEGYTNELDPEARALDAFYRQFTCKNCQSSSLKKELDTRHAFSDPNTAVPRSLLRCRDCTCLFDPHSGILLEKGVGTKDAPGIPIIRSGR